jgi:uncharacterized membrane protein YjjB (DUF3815 family)
LICCLVPMAAILAVSVFNVPLDTLLWVGLVALCPLSHLLMMKYMMPGKQHDHEGSVTSSPAKRITPATPQSDH